jgi:asparagine synthetase B (glutamine-hydrolysing)
VPLCMESIRYVLAQQLTGTDPLLVGCAEKRYPFLDRSLFAFLASIPRTQVLQSGNRRHLMRRALQGLVPDVVLHRKTKWFGIRGPVAALQAEQGNLDALFQDRWLTDGLVVDTAVLQKHLAAAQRGSPIDAIALRTAIGIEQWLRAQIKHGTVELEPHMLDRVRVPESALPRS